MFQSMKTLIVVCLCFSATLPGAECAAVAPTNTAATTAATAVQYQVEYRHSKHTNGEWRVGVAWTSDYNYAKATYDYYVRLQTYDVRLYKRGR